MFTYEINAADIRHNIDTVLGRAEVPTWGVIKFDGYGMGLSFMAEMLSRCGVTRFALADAQDAKKLREDGFTDEEILLISPPGAERDIETALKYNCIFSVGSENLAERIVKTAEDMGQKARAHIKVDTGLGRYGFFQSEYEKIKKLYNYSETLSIEGIYSHFSGAYLKTKKTMRQFEMFSGVLTKLEADGIDRGMAHIANSPALFRLDGVKLDAVRIGSALVGRVTGTTSAETGLKRAGILKGEVSEIRIFPKNHNIGYGNRIKVRRETKVAVLTVGKWHGLETKAIRLRKIPITVTINGAQYKSIGKLGDGNVSIDVTGSNVAVGDVVKIDINPLRLNRSVVREYI